MKKKLLLWLLSLVMMISTLTVGLIFTTSAGISAASIGETYYASLDAAIAAADDGDIVTLQTNVEANVEANFIVSSNKRVDITIDLNGYNLTAGYILVYSGDFISVVNTAATRSELCLTEADDILLGDVEIGSGIRVKFYKGNFEVNDTTRYLASGAQIVEVGPCSIDGGDGTYVDIGASGVASIGGTTYATLAEAIAAAQAYGKIDLTGDVYLTGTLNIGKSIVIDGHNFTITSDPTTQNGFNSGSAVTKSNSGAIPLIQITGADVEVVFENLKVVTAQHERAAISLSATLTMRNCYVKHVVAGAAGFHTIQVSGGHLIVDGALTVKIGSCTRNYAGYNPWTYYENGIRVSTWTAISCNANGDVVTFTENAQGKVAFIDERDLDGGYQILVHRQKKDATFEGVEYAGLARAVGKNANYDGYVLVNGGAAAGNNDEFVDKYHPYRVLGTYYDDFATATAALPEGYVLQAETKTYGSDTYTVYNAVQAPEGGFYVVDDIFAFTSEADAIALGKAVAYIAGTKAYYSTLQGALDAAAVGEETTIELLNNVIGDKAVTALDSHYYSKNTLHGSFLIEEGKTIVLNLNGYTVYCCEFGEETTSTNRIAAILNLGTLTINLDGGNIIAVRYCIQNAGTLTINDADSENYGHIYTTGTLAAHPTLMLNGSGTTTINGGIIGDADDDMYNQNLNNRGAAILNYATGTLTINGGRLTCFDNHFLGEGKWSYVIRNEYYDTNVVINGGSIYGCCNGLVAGYYYGSYSYLGNSITINGGDFRLDNKYYNNGEVAGNELACYIFYTPFPTTLTINGGNFTRSNSQNSRGLISVNEGSFGNSCGRVYVNGGNFDFDYWGRPVYNDNTAANMILRGGIYTKDPRVVNITSGGNYGPFDLVDDGYTVVIKNVNGQRLYEVVKLTDAPEGGFYVVDGVDQYMTEEEALAVGVIAYIDGTHNYYTDLQIALDAVTEENDTVVLLDSITSQNGYLVSKSAKLDLNEKAITVTAGSNVNSRAFKITNGTFEVYNGYVDAQGGKNETGTGAAAGYGCYGAFRAEIGTELVLHDLILANYRPWGLNIKLLGATATLNNVAIFSVYGGGIEVSDDEGADGTVPGYASLTECTITQVEFFDWCSVPVSVSGDSIVDVYSSDYEGVYGAYVFSSGGTINIHGGSFSADDDHFVLKTTYDSQYGNDAFINVYDGIFEGTFDIGTTGHEFLTIYGGTFDTDPVAYVPANYLILVYEDELDKTWYQVVDPTDEEFDISLCKVIDGRYLCMTEADAVELCNALYKIAGTNEYYSTIDLVPNKSSIELVANVQGLVIPEDKTYSINLNEKSIAYLYTNGTLTIGGVGGVDALHTYGITYITGGDFELINFYNGTTTYIYDAVVDEYTAEAGANIIISGGKFYQEIIDLYAAPYYEVAYIENAIPVAYWTVVRSVTETNPTSYQSSIYEDDVTTTNSQVTYEDEQGVPQNGATVTETVSKSVDNALTEEKKESLIGAAINEALEGVNELIENDDDKASEQNENTHIDTTLTVTIKVEPQELEVVTTDEQSEITTTTTYTNVFDVKPTVTVKVTTTVGEETFEKTVTNVISNDDLQTSISFVLPAVGLADGTYVDVYHIKESGETVYVGTFRVMNEQITVTTTSFSIFYFATNDTVTQQIADLEALAAEGIQLNPEDFESEGEYQAAVQEAIQEAVAEEAQQLILADAFENVDLSGFVAYMLTDTGVVFAESISDAIAFNEVNETEYTIVLLKDIEENVIVYDGTKFTIDKSENNYRFNVRYVPVDPDLFMSTTVTSANEDIPNEILTVEFWQQKVQLVIPQGYTINGFEDGQTEVIYISICDDEEIHDGALPGQTKALKEIFQKDYTFDERVAFDREGRPCPLIGWKMYYLDSTADGPIVRYVTHEVQIGEEPAFYTDIFDADAETVPGSQFVTIEGHTLYVEPIYGDPFVAGIIGKVDIDGTYTVNHTGYDKDHISSYFTNAKKALTSVDNKEIVTLYADVDFWNIMMDQSLSCIPAVANAIYNTEDRDGRFFVDRNGKYNYSLNIGLASLAVRQQVTIDDQSEEANKFIDEYYFQDNSFVLAFDPEGGEWNYNGTTSDKVNLNYTLTSIAWVQSLVDASGSTNPVKAGFVFDGWYTENGVELNDSITMPANDFTIYAKWKLLDQPATITADDYTVDNGTYTRVYDRDAHYFTVELTGEDEIDGADDTIVAEKNQTLTYKWYKVEVVEEEEVETEFATGNTISLTNVSDSGLYRLYVTYEDRFGTQEPVKIGDYTLTITPKSLTSDDITITLTNELTYNGSEQTQEFTVKDGDAELVEGEDYVINNNSNKGTNAGDYTLVIEGIGNYKDVDDNDDTAWTIAPKSLTSADITIELTNELTYNATEQTQGFIVKDGNTTLVLDVDYEIIVNADYNNKGTDADDYTLKISGKGNYKDAKTADWAIAQKAATISVNAEAVPALTKVFGAADPYKNSGVESTLDLWPVTITGVEVGDTLNYTIARAAGENVGEYAITITLGNNPNYNVTANNGFFTITAKSLTSDDITITLDNTLTYNGEEQTQLFTVKDGETELVLDTDYEIVLVNNIATNKGTNAGGYELKITGMGNYAGEKTKAWTIAKKAATIAVDANADPALTKVYGADDPYRNSNVQSDLDQWPVTTTGLVGQDTLNYTIARAAGENVGEYAITITVGENQNYDVTTVTDGTFTITNATITPTFTQSGFEALHKDATVTYADFNAAMGKTILTADAANDADAVISYRLPGSTEYKAGTSTDEFVGLTATAGNEIVVEYKITKANHEDKTGSFTVKVSVARYGNADSVEDGSNYFTTLKGAVDAAAAQEPPVNNVTLLTDETTAQSINVTKNVTINLNGNTYTYTGSANADKAFSLSGTTEPNFTLTGGTVNSSSRGIQAEGQSRVELDGVKLTANTFGIRMNVAGAALAIKNSRIISNDTAVYANNLVVAESSIENSNIYGKVSLGSTGAIIDGTDGNSHFSVNVPSKYVKVDGDQTKSIVKADFTDEDDDDREYQYTVGIAVAEVNGVNYSSFEKVANGPKGALEAAAELYNGTATVAGVIPTITLLKSYTNDEVIDLYDYGFVDSAQFNVVSKAGMNYTFNASFTYNDNDERFAIETPAPAQNGIGTYKMSAVVATVEYNNGVENVSWRGASLAQAFAKVNELAGADALIDKIVTITLKNNTNENIDAYEYLNIVDTTKYNKIVLDLNGKDLNGTVSLAGTYEVKSDATSTVSDLVISEGETTLTSANITYEKLKVEFAELTIEAGTVVSLDNQNQVKIAGGTFTNINDSEGGVTIILPGAIFNIGKYDSTDVIADTDALSTWVNDHLKPDEDLNTQIVGDQVVVISAVNP